MRLLIPIFILVAFSQPPLDGPRYYVNSKSGLIVHSKPSMSSGKLGILPFGYEVMHFDWMPNDSFQAEMEGKKRYFHWLKIPYKDGVGYIASNYVVSFNPVISDSVLYDFEVVLTDSNNFRYDKYHRAGSADYYSAKYDEYIPVNFNDIVDTIKSFIKIEQVNLEDYEDKKVFNVYDVDTTPVYKKVPYPYEKAVEHYRWGPEDYGDANSFILYFENGDSTHLHDIHDKYYTNVFYVGRILALNKYIICNLWETEEYELIDIKTGEYVETEDYIYYFDGIPRISPDAKYLVEFSVGLNLGVNESILMLSTFDKDSIKKDKFFEITFKDWLPNYSKRNFFWVSDRSFIVEVQPRDFFQTDYMYIRNQWEKPPKQYLKITIQ